MSLGRLARDTALYGVSDGLVRAISFLTLPIYTRILTPDDFGWWAWILTVVGLLSIVAGLGSGSTYARFFFDTDNAGHRARTTSGWFASVFLVAMLAAAAMTAATLLFGGEVARGPMDTAALLVAIWSMPLTLVNELCSQALRNEFRIRSFSLLNIATIALTVGLSLVFLLGFGWGVLGLASGLLVSALVMLPIRAWSIRHLVTIRVGGFGLVAMARFGGPLVVAGMAFWVFQTSDRLILGWFSSLEALALYAVAVSLTGPITMLQSSFGQAWSPRALAAYQSDETQARGLYGRACTALVVLFGLIGLGLTLGAPFIVAIWAAPAYLPAYTAVAPLALAGLAYATTQVTAAPINLTKRTHHLMIHTAVAAVINVVLNLLFVPEFGMLAAAWATAVAFWYLTVAYGIVSHRLWRIEYQWSRLAAAAGVIVPSIVLANLLPPAFDAPGVAMRLGLAAAVLGLLGVFGVVRPHELAQAAAELLRVPAALRLRLPGRAQ